MKFFFSILFWLTTVNCPAQPTEEQKLITAVQQFHQALVTKNTVSLNQQTDRALSYGHSNGWVETKKDLINDLTGGVISYQSFKEDSFTVSISGNVASVRFKAEIEATMKETTAHFHLSVLEVWIKKGKRWVLFARQAVKQG